MNIEEKINKYLTVESVNLKDKFRPGQRIMALVPVTIKNLKEVQSSGKYETVAEAVIDVDKNITLIYRLGENRWAEASGVQKGMF